MSLELKTLRPRLLGPGSLWHLRVCENPLWQHLELEHLHGSTRAESGDALAALFQRHGGWFQQFAAENSSSGLDPRLLLGFPPGALLSAPVGGTWLENEALGLGFSGDDCFQNHFMMGKPFRWPFPSLELGITAKTIISINEMALISEDR